MCLADSVTTFPDNHWFVWARLNVKSLPHRKTAAHHSPTSQILPHHQHSYLPTTTVVMQVNTSQLAEPSTLTGLPEPLHTNTQCYHKYHCMEMQHR